MLLGRSVSSLSRKDGDIRCKSQCFGCFNNQDECSKCSLYACVYCNAIDSIKSSNFFKCNNQHNEQEDDDGSASSDENDEEKPRLCRDCNYKINVHWLCGSSFYCDLCKRLRWCRGCDIETLNIPLTAVGGGEVGTDLKDSENEDSSDSYN